MIGTLVGIIITLLIIGIAWWAIDQLLPIIPLAEPIRKIIYVLLMVVLALIIIFYILLPLLGLIGIPVGHYGFSMR